MIVFSFVAEESVIALFLAGIGPGLFACLFCRFFNGLRQVLGSVQTDAQGFAVGTEESAKSVFPRLLWRH